MSYLEINGARIFYEVLGEGPPIVFIHGWGMDHQYWNEQVATFSKSHRTIALDWRGMGRSSGGEFPYGFHKLVDDLTALLDALNVHQPVVCGHSLGGDIALQFGISRPNALSALILVDAPGPKNFYTRSFNYRLLSIGTAVASLFVKNCLSPFVWIFKYLFFHRQFDTAHPEVLAAWKRQFLTNSRRAILNAGFAQAYWKPSPGLDQITVPTLILRGSHDHLVPEREAQAYQKRVTGSKFHQINEASHTLMVQRPLELNEVIMRFLSEMDASGSTKRR